MYENFKNKYRYDASNLDIHYARSFSPDPYEVTIPGPRALWYGGRPNPFDLWYSDWRDECLANHLTCTISTAINPSPVFKIRGPEAKQFISDSFVNDVERFPVGSTKHGIMCIDNGQVACHGVLLRTGEEEFESFWHAPYLQYAFTKKNYDAEMIDMTTHYFAFQLQGPRSLEILEEVTGDDLHDIKFCRFRDSAIDGHKVRILRFGMANCLGYEVHGEAKYSKECYLKIMQVGEKYGIRPLGVIAYMQNHIAGGNMQMGHHFMSAASKDANYVQYLKDQNASWWGIDPGSDNAIENLPGSMGTNAEKRMFNPFELGLGRCVNFNHDFTGKEALLEYAKNQTRTGVTLLWNPEDIAKIEYSQLNPAGEPYQPIDIMDFVRVVVSVTPCLQTSIVYDKEGNEIGCAMSRTQDVYHRATISLGSLDVRFANVGTEVFILWGDPGYRQTLIRATVVPTPFNKHLDNRSFDVETIPHPSR